MPRGNFSFHLGNLENQCTGVYVTFDQLTSIIYKPFLQFEGTAVCKRIGGLNVKLHFYQIKDNVTILHSPQATQKFWENLRKLVHSLIGFETKSEGHGDNSEIFEHNLRIVVKIFPAVSSCGGAIQNTCSHRTVRVGKRVLCRNKISQNFSFTRRPLPHFVGTQRSN